MSARLTVLLDQVFVLERSWLVKLRPIYLELWILCGSLSINLGLREQQLNNWSKALAYHMSIGLLVAWWVCLGFLLQSFGFERSVWYEHEIAFLLCWVYISI